MHAAGAFLDGDYRDAGRKLAEGLRKSNEVNGAEDMDFQKISQLSDEHVGENGSARAWDCNETERQEVTALRLLHSTCYSLVQ